MLTLHKYTHGLPTELCKKYRTCRPSGQVTKTSWNGCSGIISSTFSSTGGSSSWNRTNPAVRLWRTLISTVPMVTMAHSAVNCRNTHTHMDHMHLLTHFTSTQLQPDSAKRQLSFYFSVHAGVFRVSVIHRTLTLITGSLMCVHDHSCACIHTRGWAHHQWVMPHKCFLRSWGIRTFVL